MPALAALCNFRESGPTQASVRAPCKKRVFPIKVTYLTRYQDSHMFGTDLAPTVSHPPMSSHPKLHRRVERLFELRLPSNAARGSRTPFANRTEARRVDDRVGATGEPATQPRHATRSECSIARRLFVQAIHPTAAAVL